MAVVLDDGVLCCPSCGGRNLHHAYVSSYDRSCEDAALNMLTIVRAGCLVQAPCPTKQNPSSRRSGVAIGFWCENCPEKCELTVAQHKGESAVEWRNSQPESWGEQGVGRA
jgi:hypothetical protein